MLRQSILLAVAAAFPVHVIASSVARIGDVAYYVPDKVEVRVYLSHIPTRPLIGEEVGRCFRCQKAAPYHGRDFDR